MAHVLTVLSIVAPVMLLAGIGFSWVRLGFAYDVEFVTRLGMTLAVPCLVFVSLMRADIEQVALVQLFIAGFLGYVAMIAVLYLGLRVLGLSQTTYLMPLSFGNTGNLGLPLALFAFGEQGLAFGVIVFAWTSILSFTFGVWVVSGGGSARVAFREPLVWATIAGSIFLVMGWQTPLWLTNALSLIGQMAIPLMLLTLGVALSKLRLGRVRLALGLSIAKLCVALAVGFLIAHLLGLEWRASGVLILQLATPVAVSSYLLAQKYGTEASEVAGLVVTSTLLSVVTLPLVLGFLL